MSLSFASPPTRPSPIRSCNPRAKQARGAGREARARGARREGRLVICCNGAVVTIQNRGLFSEKARLGVIRLLSRLAPRAFHTSTDPIDVFVGHCCSAGQAEAGFKEHLRHGAAMGAGSAKRSLHV